MVFRRLLGGSAAAPGPSAPAQGSPDAETATVRRIVAELEALPSERARWLAGFAYVLGRAANADLVTTDEELRLMERIVMDHGGLPEAQAVLVVEIARQQARLVGGTEDYLVTREWVRTASEEDRLALLRCCFLVGAVDSISAQESAVLNEIANELQFDPPVVARIRGEFTDEYAVVQAMRTAAGSPGEPPAG
jgi:uncharacterized tellurite resistance protein B-like protein